MSAADFGRARLLLSQETPPIYLNHEGFPARLHIGAIAALQTGHLDDEVKRAKQYEDLCSALIHAAKEASTLPFEDLEYRREPWVENGIQRGFHVTAAAWIDAADAASWLQSHDDDCGPLLALWFKARGVACPERQHHHPAPAAAPASAFPLADWAALVAYRKANPGKDWGLGNQLYILRAELERRIAGGKGKSAAQAAMAGELNMSRQALCKTLGHRRKRASPSATPFPSESVTAVRDGKRPRQAA